MGVALRTWVIDVFLTGSGADIDGPGRRPAAHFRDLAEVADAQILLAVFIKRATADYALAPTDPGRPATGAMGCAAGPVAGEGGDHGKQGPNAPSYRLGP